MAQRMTTTTVAMVTMVMIGLMTGSSGQADQSGVPVVVVMLDETMERENSKIQDIFAKMPTLAKSGETAVRFETVIVANETSAHQEACNKLQDGMVAMVDMTSKTSAPLLRSLAGNAGVAYVSLVDASFYSNAWGDEETTWTVEPASVQLLRVIADIVRKEELNNVALVYDDTFATVITSLLRRVNTDIVREEELKKAALVYDETFDIQNTPRRILTNVPAQHSYNRISDDDADTARQVRQIRDTSKSVFVIASFANAQRFLEEINNQKTETPFLDIFVLTKEGKVQCNNCVHSVRIMTMLAKTSLSARDEYMSYISISGIDEIKVDEALTYDVARLIQSSLPSVLTNIAYSSCENVTSARNTDRQQSKLIVDTLRNQTVEGVFGRLGAEHGTTTSYDLTLMLSEMTVENGHKSTEVLVGEWSEDSGLNVTTTLTIANRKRRYRVVTVPGVPPFVYKDENINGTGGPRYYGYCIELLDSLKEKMEFEYDIYDSPDGLFGSMAEDGSWTGVINELLQKNADIALGPISVMAERENVVDFTVPYYDLVGLTILMRKPTFDYSLGKFLIVLDEGVWGCILAAFFLFSILICIFDRLSPFSYQNNRKEWKGEGQEPRIFTFKEGIWFCMMSLTPQGGGETPRALSGRLVAATWWLFGFIIIATYTANLAAFLTVSRLETKIESLDDLSKQFKVKYAPMNGSNAQMYFRRMADIEKRFYVIWKEMSLSNTMEAVERAKLAVWDYPVSDQYTKLWNTMADTGFPATQEQAIEQVLTGNFAFIADASTNKYTTYTDCDMWEVGEEFSRKPYALAVQEGSPLRSELSNVILQLINQRKLEEMKTKWWYRDKLECPDSEDESDGISIRNIGGVFLVIVIGSALALVMLAMECYWYKFKPKQKKKLYSVTGRTNLKPGTTPGTNGVKTVDGGMHSGGGATTTPTPREENGYTNDGFMEMTERL